ncbi:MAG: zinc-dependent alcohol dehydrogenase [Candidatus Melainabacteria bacterium]|nr:zinc-dependent alcohol dehydrogenase [Candidatus Melainabacteria bacterium]
MKALTWHGKKDVRVSNVEDPRIVLPTDAIIQVTSSAICGSDLHIYHGFVSAMEKGDILGHEFAGRVIEVGSEVSRVKVGDRVVIPFTISCGSCEQCSQKNFSLCTKSNPNGDDLCKLMGFPTAGLYGYSHMYGGFSGGQAEFVRVPFVDVGAIVLPEEISEEHALFLSDIFPTGYMAAENCNIQPGQTVAVWGCGAVGQFAIRSAFLLGAEKVIAIDRFPERLKMAAEAGATTLDYTNLDDVPATIRELTGGRGPDACIDAVGMESHAMTPDAVLDEVLQALKLETDRPHVLRQAIKACRPGGVISIPGVFVGILDNFPLGVAFGKGLTFKMGQTHVQRYSEGLLDLIVKGKIDPRFVITHRIALEGVPEAYETFSKKEDAAIKFVIEPKGQIVPKEATAS